jgi:diguanylate cyclase (GGDEF)-like protein/PAS domain S-box-containing protein
MDAPLFKAVQFRLSAIVVGVTVIAMGLFGSALLYHVARTEREAANTSLQETSRRIRSMLTLSHELMIVAAEKNFTVFAGELAGPVRIDSRRTMTAGTREVPLLSIGGRAVVPDLPLINEFTKASGGSIATIFVRQGDDFVRLATSLKNSEGERAVGTVLDRNHPAYRRLLDGWDYLGAVRLYDRSYMAKYRPLLDDESRVVGALFVGLDLSATFARIGEELRSIRFGETGYVFVLDDRQGDRHGLFLVHPAYQGRTVFDVADANTAKFFGAALEDANKETIVRYSMNDVSGQSREEIASFIHFPEWHWVIGAAAEYSEFAKRRLDLQYAVTGTIVVAVLAMIGALHTSIRRLVLRPVLELNESLRTSEERFRSLVAWSDDLIYTTDAAGRLTGIFGKGQAALPGDAGKIAGLTVTGFLGTGDPQHEAAHARALRGEHVIYDWKTGGCGSVDFQSSLSPMYDINGAVCGLVVIGRDVTDRQRAEELARYQAQHDTLTGLPNRALMQDRLQQAILHAGRNERLVGVLFVDLDHFKEVNDRFGHDIGDELLKAVAQRLLSCVRQSDTVARIGGDEFVVVIGDAANREALAQVGDKMLQAFGDTFKLSACTLAMSPSIGIASYPADGHDPATLLKAADAAMYRAKMAGRSTSRFTEAGAESEAPVVSEA